MSLAEWWKRHKMWYKIAKAWLWLAVTVVAIFLVLLLIQYPLVVGSVLFILFTAMALDTINLKE